MQQLVSSFLFLRLKTWTTNSKIANLVTENVLQLEFIVSYFKQWYLGNEWCSSKQHTRLPAALFHGGNCFEIPGLFHHYIVLVPICILTNLYGATAWTLKAESKKMQKESWNHQTRLSEQSKKVVRSSVIIITAFGLCVITQLRVFPCLSVCVWNWKEPPICAFRTAVPFIATFMLNAWSALNPCFCFIFIKSYQITLRSLRVFCSRRSPENHPKSLDLTIYPSTFANSTKMSRCRSTRVWKQSKTQFNAQQSCKSTLETLSLSKRRYLRNNVNITAM